MFPHDATERRCSGCVSRILRSTPSALQRLTPETPALGPPIGRTRPMASLARQKPVVPHPWSVVRVKSKRPCLAVASREGGFTLLELLIVLGIIAVLLVLLAPAFTTIKSGGDVTSAAYTIKGVLDTARTYAKANDTYTWVGFYEEDVSSAVPGTLGVGRLVMSIVASKNGTIPYTLPLGSPFTLDPSPPNPATLIQVGKLTKIDNVHLKTFPAPTATPPPDTFDTRPVVTSTAQIGDVTPPNPYLLFHCPVNTVPAQYTFTKVIQFSPRGEGLVDDSTYFASGANLPRFSEIGVEQTHGASTPGSIPANVVAIQLNSFAGDVRIYRR